MQRDLPLFLDAPMGSRSRAARPGDRERDPVERALRGLHPRLAAGWAQDRDLVRRMPVLAAVPALLAVIAFVVFGVMRTGIIDIYSESVLFLVVAVVIGMLSPTVGALFVVAIGIADGQHAIPSIIGTADADPSTPLGWWPLVAGLAGRLVAYILLWLLVVEVSLLARQAAASGPVSWLAARVGAAEPVVHGATAGVTAAFLALVWTAAMPLVIRAVFMWANWSQPSVWAIYPVQSEGWPIVIAAGVAAGLVCAFVAFLMRGREQEAEVTDDVSGRRGHASWIVPRLIGLLLLGSLVSGPIDIALLVLALFAGPLLAQRLWAVAGFSGLLQRVPALIRFVAAYGVSLVVAQWIVSTTFEGVPGSPFFPVLAATGVGVVLYDMLLGPPAALSAANTRARVPAVAAAAVLVAAGVLSLLAPAVVLADDCDSPSDCYFEPIVITVTVVTTVYAVRRPMGPPTPPPVRPPPPYHDVTFYKRWHRWHDYWYPDQKVQYKPDPNVNPNPKSFASSGTGTRA